jgi:tRNA (uracil-5-)-methyltransferase
MWRAMPLQNIRPADYSTLLAEKVVNFRRDFSAVGAPAPAVFPSPALHFRLRVEFRMYHLGDRVDYAMFAASDSKRPVVIDEFPIAAQPICAAMTHLRELLQGNHILSNRLYQVNFLTTLSGELMITLIYHKVLDPSWESAARELAATLKAKLIGRSHRQKIVLDTDWVTESFELDGRVLQYQQIEGSFTQPNGAVNRQMLSWVRAQVAANGGDLLELYCGNGNFTVALAPLFTKVLATEISKTSVKAAHYNLDANQISNVALVRLSSEEISQALARTRVFNRLDEIDLDRYQLNTLFVDPPRSGLDAETIELARGFERIIYISCNPATLLENVVALQPTHEIAAAALFDQFPYTHHLECGLVLTRRASASGASRGGSAA